LQVKPITPDLRVLGSSPVDVSCNVRVILFKKYEKIKIFLYL
jgi:hypothetical protein